MWRKIKSLPWFARVPVMGLVLLLGAYVASRVVIIAVLLLGR